MKRIGCILTIGLWLTLTGWATTYYVAPGGSDDPANPGTNWDTALATISNAVFLARTSDGNLILVTNGAYTVTDQVAITNGTTVAGVGGSASVFINGNYPATTNRAFQLSHGNAVVDGFTITNCAAGAGGGGGAVYIQDNGRVLNCVLAFNQSTNIGYDSTGGGAVYLNSGGLLTNCVISNNTANLGVGGGAYLYKGGVLSNCTIVANSASNSSGYTGAGVFIRITAASQASRVTGCVFSNNIGLYQGGGLLLYQTAGAVDAALIDACTFVTNVAGGYGGGVRLIGGGVVSNCDIINNKSLESGGGAYLSGGGRIVNCTNISGNVATNLSWGGGGVFLATGTRAENCRVTGNTGKRGGGIRFSGSIVVTGCVISGNTGSDYGGGGVWAESSGWTVQDCVFSNNNAANYGGGVGVVGVSGNTGAIQRCEFVNNIAGASGGGIDTIGGSAAGFVAVVQDCVFRGNAANGSPGGGGIYYPGGTGRVENCQFTENRSANAWCGAGGYFGAGVQVRNCLFTKNVAVSYAGGAYLGTNGNNGGEFVACTVVSNKGGMGGGLYLVGTNNVLLNSVIYSNTATTSNDLYLASDPANNTLTYNCTPATLSGAGNITNNPRFMNPADGTWRLAAASPCINAGTNQTWMDTAIDLFGQPRIRYGRADMGCYEYFLNVKINGIPIDRVKSINSVPKNRIFRISE